MVTAVSAPPATATRHRMRPVPVVVALLAVAAGTLAAAQVPARIFSGSQLPVLLAAATLGAVAGTLLLRLLRAGPVLAVVVGLVGLVACLVGATAALRDATGGGLAAVLADALRNSGARILTSAIPVPPTPDTVLLPIAATWLAASIGTVLLGPVRADSGGPHRRAALAAVPMVLLLVGGLVLVGPNGTASYPLLAVVVLAVAAVLVVSGQPWSAPAAESAPSAPVRRAGRVARLRRAGAGVVVLAVLASAAVAGGPVLAGLVHRQPVDPRAYVTPPHRQVDQLNPLGMLAAWALDPHRKLLTVRTDRPERLRWATLSTYDGISWQPDRTYRAAGSVLPPPTDTADPTVTVHQRITIDSLGGSFLPAAPGVRQVRGVRVGYDTGSGALLTPGGLSPGLSYRTVSAVPRRDPDRLAAAPVATGPSAARYLHVPPGVPEGIVRLARRTASSGAPYRRALLLERLLRTRYRYWSKAPSGNGYITLKHFLLTRPDKGGGRGTSEQFATAFALMARIVGLPSRVIVGFHAGHRTGPGRYQVTSGDAFAWPEVRFVGHGWVAFDPTPAAGKGATPPDENTPQARSQQKQKSRQLDEAPTPTPSAPVPSASAGGRAAAAGAGRVPTGLLGGGAGLAVLVLLMVAVPVVRWRRGIRRLGTGPPAARILGAWAEVRDALRMAGVRRDPALSAVETARLAAATGPDRPGDPPLPDLVPLARAVNAVLFAPTVGADVPAGDCGALARDYRRSLRSRLSVPRRLLWLVDPRPLFWR